MAGKSEETDREIVIHRVLNAPRERVWEAITDPAQIDLWWGPSGFRNVTHECSVRPGGVWRHTMHGPDGAEYPNVTRFEEVIAPERLVYTNGGGRRGGRGATFRATWTLRDLGTRTEITMRLVFRTREERDFVVKEFDAIQGGGETLARLAAHLGGTPAFEVVLDRILRAPRDRVFEAWSDPDQMVRWFAPKPYELQILAMDFRPGGRFRMAMRGPDGVAFPFSGTYREIVRPSRLVWTGEFPDGPADQMTTVVLFEEEGEGTRVRVSQTFHVITPTIERAVQGARQGWAMTLDQMAAFCDERGGFRGPRSRPGAASSPQPKR